MNIRLNTCGSHSEFQPLFVVQLCLAPYTNQLFGFSLMKFKVLPSFTLTVLAVGVVITAKLTVFSDDLRQPHFTSELSEQFAVKSELISSDT